ncbi:hypothetical protein U3516DRAFT_855094 [Neocallimastix sp. 'constans']
MKWNISQAQAYRYLICAKVLDQLEEFEIKPSYERLCKSLSKVAKTPAEIKILWSVILKKTGGRPNCINKSISNETIKFNISNSNSSMVTYTNTDTDSSIMSNSTVTIPNVSFSLNNDLIKPYTMTNNYNETMPSSYNIIRPISPSSSTESIIYLQLSNELPYIYQLQQPQQQILPYNSYPSQPQQVTFYQEQPQQTLYYYKM